ncbi:MAG: hypothetical protein OEU50_12430 [Gammaproteobacteria bacterium]|nr:hypothetical protein [Gammaproteobacteria bacterium]
MIRLTAADFGLLMPACILFMPACILFMPSSSTVGDSFADDRKR